MRCMRMAAGRLPKETPSSRGKLVVDGEKRPWRRRHEKKLDARLFRRGFLFVTSVARKSLFDTMLNVL